jgi:hypothetical protein
MSTDFRALCAELLDWVERASDFHTHETHDMMRRAHGALAQPEPVALSPKEVDAQEAFTQLRDEILDVSGPLEINEVLNIIDNYTPEWV